MAPTLVHTLTPLCLLLILAQATVANTAVGDATKQLSLHLDTEDMSMMSVFDDVVDATHDDEELLVSGGRSLLWWRMRYYISYGALSANRIPCPPRSGRSYYTHNCWRARGPVHPYSRGCSTITRCRR
ncbi:putative rapid ALkalinization Factor [Helianthus annuus]|uniref:Rapid ALkalinization Factor n=1 Tax=Helianthus annuus TaxID=4232 RepID=A0A251T4U3_HELAN|nr:protein RALF-like 34 [Helianthus annuus]KAF5778887.1 putative rapid ALkalinization Factor [Helianthus annuus]KAJ0490230.1 putative rapid ALkalinization Factor [Helianthus annuus]KAJ0494377.1 putative rapid ALkalinization Factor [Helianthus annuus]KAJ0506149.1 putative rapid ALkalinization Factor [Helianthus annuus]KAJ0675820.1 putative rapid ALkalinization Factor [Helianthus annuus]